MVALAEKAKADKTIPMRVQESIRDLIDRAAELSGKSRTEFILESATAHAIDVLLDQRLFLVDDQQMAAVEAALANPPKPTAALKALLKTRSPWE